MGELRSTDLERPWKSRLGGSRLDLDMRSSERFILTSPNEAKFEGDAELSMIQMEMQDLVKMKTSRNFLK